MLRVPIWGSRLRWLAIGYGGLLFLWLGIEDNTVGPVTALGLTLAALLVAYQVCAKLGGRIIPARYGLPGAALTGAIIGLGASLATTALMLFKNALHAHIFLDFPPGLMLDMLARGPVWALAGGLFGLGCALAWLALRR